MRGNSFKLDFLIVGAQKSGTTAIEYFLKQHPEVSMGKVKELHFFDNDELFRNEKIDYKILHDQLEIKKQGRVTGECTPIYMFWDPCMERIWNYNPEIKIIAILRNPVKRAFSQWNMEKKRNYVTDDFYSCLQAEIKMQHENPAIQKRVCSFIARGFYSGQIKRIFRFFKKEQVLFIKYEDFNNNQLGVLNRIFDFIGVKKELFEYKEARVLNLEYTNEMSAREKEILLNLYKNEISEIENMLNWNCDDWRI